MSRIKVRDDIAKMIRPGRKLGEKGAEEVVAVLLIGVPKITIKVPQGD